MLYKYILNSKMEVGIAIKLRKQVASQLEI